jgi:hypothetical protein
MISPRSGDAASTAHRDDQRRLEEQQDEYEDCLNRIRSEDNWIVSPEDWCEGLRPSRMAP